MKSFESRIKSESFIKIEKTILWFLALNDVKAAKDHGKTFRSRLVASFSGIVHYSL